MAEDVHYSVVLPSYLEGENLRILIPRILSELGCFQERSEIIVVDTPRPLDDTRDICEKNGVRYVNRTPGESFGDAVRTGIREARGKWILFMDADGSHTPEFIPRLIEETGANDIVVASRYIDGGFTENSRPLAWMSRILNVTYSLILNLEIKDVSNNFKIYRADLLKKLSLRCENFDIIEEILFKICRLNAGIRIKEIPFSFKKRMFGQTKRNLLLFMLTYVFTILRLRFMSLR